jgi:hypothetical protein
MAVKVEQLEFEPRISTQLSKDHSPIAAFLIRTATEGAP